MTAEEMLNSDDIETAQLAANIIYREDRKSTRLNSSHT